MQAGDLVRIEAAAVVDAAGVFSSPGAILVQNHEILEVGRVDRVSAPPNARTVKHPQAVVVPAFVNAHTHLDLTHIGPIPCTGCFRSWVDVVRAQRVFEESDLVASVRNGIERSKVGGAGILGDIAGVGSVIPGRVLAESSVPGVSYIEFFGIGVPREQAACEQIMERAAGPSPRHNNMRFGMQPHAPYSCGESVYHAALETGWPVSTHLAETLEEILFVHEATGPLAELLRDLGVWHESIRPRHRHPVDALLPVFGNRSIAAAHLNYVNDAHIEALAQSRVSVVYCPRASAYFDHPHDQQPAHRYRDMVQAGINVALGTDSILCLDTPDRLSILDEMRFLHQRDTTDPLTLLRMATANGARALGINPEVVTLSAGPTVGLLAIEAGQPGPFTDASAAVQAMLSSDALPHWVVETTTAPIENLFTTDDHRDTLS